MSSFAEVRGSELAKQVTVHVVDDDPSVRRGLSRLIKASGFDVEVFASAEEFMKHEPSSRGGCIVLDVQMPGLDGFDLQEYLARLDCSMPVIFITGHGDIPMSVRAMKKGAVDFLAKPFDEHELLDAIAVALARNMEALDRRARATVVNNRISTLTSREREVMGLVVAGLLNKQIAAELHISEKTVKIHRGRVMFKMGVASITDLVRLCAEVGALRPA